MADLTPIYLHYVENDIDNVGLSTQTIPKEIYYQKNNFDLVFKKGDDISFELKTIELPTLYT